ncbi:hypothetical protein PoB_000282500 [Plakobranchus ocellatus]|uniref:Uncharacterized protein n=1 Tax=Plakobranchus ocellatus TaxID=259542 RepID=A0AAV3Y077_9GAST|nr:hypothetical protein PoB_000282500 [Plakobranchus ocellatus]
MSVVDQWSLLFRHIVSYDNDQTPSAMTTGQTPSGEKQDVQTGGHPYKTKPQSWERYENSCHIWSSKELFADDMHCIGGFEADQIKKAKTKVPKRRKFEVSMPVSDPSAIR